MRKIMVAAAASLMLVPSASWAQDKPADPVEEEEAEGGPWTLEGGVGLLSDYRFRGISLSDKDPEVTAELTLSHESGFYAGVWASNVALNGNADDLEVDLSAGFAPEFGAVSMDIGAVYYLYPGNSDFNYVELLASASTEVGPATMTLGVAYAPAQENIGDVDNTYVYISGDLPIGESPVSVHGSFGIEDGAFGDAKRDWLLGATYDFGGGFSATLDYVDTARAYSSLGDATVVASVAFGF